ncbi:MAG: hypothetical protein ACYC3X_22635 [Pirellulaceae bacterium]
MKRATGHQTETLRRVVWDVAPWLGKKAHILIADHSQEAWGVINADDRYALTDSKPRQCLEKRGFLQDDRDIRSTENPVEFSGIQCI